MKMKHLLIFIVSLKIKYYMKININNLEYFQLL